MCSRRPVVAALFAAASLILLSPAGDTFAHAAYESSLPGKGEVVQIPPTLLEITFTTDVQRVAGTYSIDVIQDGGGPVTAGPAAVDEDDRSRVTVALQRNLRAGRYVVRWRNVSDEDGEAAEGAFSFYVQRQPTPPELAEDERLVLVGAEEAPAPTTGPGGATARPTTTETFAATAVTGVFGDNDDAGNDALMWSLIAAGVALVVVVAALGVRVTYQRRRQR